MTRARAKSASAGETLVFGARRVEVTHPDRVLFPADGITKGDLVHYYRDVAHFILPYLAKRPLTLQRWPEGIEGFSFFEKKAPKGMPDWIATSTQPRADGAGTVTYPVASDAPSLAWFANLASITFHVWMSHEGSIDRPDFLLFDLDPFEGCPLRTLARVALTVRDVLGELGLETVVKTTGGKGLHVLSPIAPKVSYADARAVNEQIARHVASLLPDEVTLERSKSKRTRGSLYFDYAQLGLGKTVVPPFTVRARPGAPVSMPIAWDEVEALGRSRATGPTALAFARWNLMNVPALLAEKGDPWGALSARRRSSRRRWRRRDAGGEPRRALPRKDDDMARAIWTGSISFGLVTIPVKLLPAIRADEDVHFHYLHAKDQGRLKTIRRCEVCGKEIAWNDVVRGYEYEKGKYVVIDDAELKALQPEATQSVEIKAFVNRDEIDPKLFDTPYYLEPEKKGRHAYALLREALQKSGKVGIAQVILRTRAHLAALSPSGNALLVELLRYPHEVIAEKEVDLPPAKEKIAAGEMKAAEMLIDAMVKTFDPAEYHDDYEEKLKAALDARARGSSKKSPKAKPAAKATNVVDLVEVLQRSLSKRPAAKAPKSTRAEAARKGAKRRAG